ncbi:MAG TPA: M20/M25/M40 family metallo-hydrolase, partial [Flavitalea sp.]|nr:M20/M25/M40 family metallo-hydrolase [Flavitalea sp.]
MDIRQLSPAPLWNHFADLNAVPRPSKKEERVVQFVRNFGDSLGLSTILDETGNVIIRKPATPGMEDRQTVLLQSHVDMVHQKNADTEFDFNTQGIDMYIDGDWVAARGTTLGADNGIGVATIMAILASNDIPHPTLEALFTVDEETGMTGALGLKGGLLKATIMLNLDTEDDHELTIGCAGGVDVTGTGSYTQESTTGDMSGYALSVTGLKGGHSGMDIHLGRGNANKLMNRLLFQAAERFELRVA